MAEMRFDGRVAVVTGAGGGLGREYALALAKRGASVVVNDLGGSFHGDGKSTKLADQVVEEIRALGGKAVANYDSVEEGEKVIKTAIDAFGRVDILINNAGILRDKSFLKMTDNDWNMIMRVHLKGAFKMTQAAWPYFKKQDYGRVIMTSSTSGTNGNFGQANYSAAKMGLIGFAKTLAIEGAKNNILCNVIVPVADSRMTKGVIPSEVAENLKPRYVAPIVLYLCHDSCPSSGDIYMSAGGSVKKIRLQLSEGHNFLANYGENFAPEKIKDHWDAIETYSHVGMPSHMSELLANIMSSVADSSSDGDSVPSSDADAENPEKLIGTEMKGSTIHFTEKDTIMYALSVGASVEDECDLKFLYEKADDFSVLPTFGVLSGMMGAESIILNTLMDRGYNLLKMLHGEQYLKLHAPFPTSGTLTSDGKLIDVIDKGKGMVLLIEGKTYNEKKELICTCQASLFFVGAGGYGGKRQSTVEIPLVKPPARTPDYTVEQVVPKNQAALYRLNQDRNPIHIDPNMAQMAGFQQPILHGLCSYGYACRHILKTVAGNDVTKFDAVKGRFSSPVLPGQTLVTQMWVEGKRVHFEVLVKETNKKAITGGYVDLKDVVSKPAAPVSSSTHSPVEDIFGEIEARIRSSPSLVKSLKAVIVYKIKGGSAEGSWIIDLKSSPPKLYKGSYSGKADLTLTTAADDFVALASGQLNPMKAFTSGKLKLSGNLGLAQKMGQLFATEAKL